jgi:hypothetical protein
MDDDSEFLRALSNELSNTKFAFSSTVYTIEHILDQPVEWISICIYSGYFTTYYTIVLNEHLELYNSFKNQYQELILADKLGSFDISNPEIDFKAAIISLINESAVKKLKKVERDGPGWMLRGYYEEDRWRCS